MDKRLLMGQNLGRVFSSRRGGMLDDHVPCTATQTAQLKVAATAQTTFRFYHVRYLSHLALGFSN
jgi:hypothetical protein